jgi:hypothetical protein
MPVAPTREDTWLITCSVDGRDLGVFDTKSGGELDSEEAKYKPGGMAAEISLGGSRTYGNLTITRYADYVRDWPLPPGVEAHDDLTAREVVDALFGHNGSALAQHLDELARWMQNPRVIEPGESSAAT